MSIPGTILIDIDTSQSVPVKQIPEQLTGCLPVK